MERHTEETSLSALCFAMRLELPGIRHRDGCALHSRASPKTETLTAGAAEYGTRTGVSLSAWMLSLDGRAASPAGLGGSS